MKKCVALVTVVVMLFLVSACSISGTNESEKYERDSDGMEENAADVISVGFSQTENNMPWRIAETNSLKGEIESRGMEFIHLDAESSIDKQQADIKTLIEMKVDYIVIAPRQETGLEVVLREAKEAGIPVILIDRIHAGVAGDDYVTYIASDHYDQGKRTAQWLAEETNGEAKIIELQGTIGSSPASDRSQGFGDEIQQYEDMAILEAQSANFTRAEGKKVMENMILTHGDEITAVFAHNDEMAIGAIQALKESGKEPGEDVIFVSIDGEKDALKAIMAGELGCSVECNPLFGPYVCDVIQKLEAGQTVDTQILLEDRIFDIENADEYIDEAF